MLQLKGLVLVLCPSALIISLTSKGENMGSKSSSHLYRGFPGAGRVLLYEFAETWGSQMFLHGDYRGYLPLFFIAVLLGYAHLASFTLLDLPGAHHYDHTISIPDSVFCLSLPSLPLSRPPQEPLSSFTISCSLPSWLALVWREDARIHDAGPLYGRPSRITWRTAVFG